MWTEWKKGQSDPEIGNWQRFLNETLSLALAEDEAFGPATEGATTTFQKKFGLEPTGTIDLLTRQIARPLGFIPFLAAKSYSSFWPGRRNVPTVLVIHTAECFERTGAADDVAAYFAGLRGPAPLASAHFVVDDELVTQCVRLGDEAWHAPGCNYQGIGIEHAGYAAQTAEEWADAFSKKELTVSARLTKKLATLFNIPIVKLSPDDLVAKKSGFAGHVDVTNAFNKGIGHQDPGPHFPFEEYLQLVRQI